MDTQKRALLAKMGALVSTLNETDWMPRSMLYLALGCDLEQAETVERIAVKAGYVEATSTTLKITDEGRRFAVDLEAAIAAAKATDEVLGGAS